ncbi:MAG: HAMP domain-containing sensor histidine kinase [Clostridium sp.]|uniref:HAMP domain-containing sensor histidine kinase n=1 Tax=Clostridium sp. TaxID=1506 RepID=UPI00290C50D5|nr:HAMP domain-containing sensor histidine kinase [Clostridium sp.]MDU7251498.1 HAMP domain-containing sensor histidine kinase [Clostridium sp.]
MWNRIFKKSIFSKLFFMNLIILVSIVISQLVFQYFYFEKYYIKQKTEELKSASQRFNQFISSNKSMEEIYDMIENINKENNVAISFRDKSLNEIIAIPNYMGSALAEIKSGDKKYKVILQGYSENQLFNEGDKLKIIGSINEFGYIYPITIYKNGEAVEKEYNMTNRSNMKASTITEWKIDPEIPLVTLEGEIISRNLEDRSYFKNNLEFNNIISKDKDIFKNIVSNYEYTSKIRLDSNEEILIYTKMYNGGVIIAITYLSQVKEVLDVMNSYYIFMFMIILGLVVITSFKYSKFISKPLIAMSKKAKDISNCNFQGEYKVTSEDEIGLLGESLNLISRNLEGTLKELKAANIKLMEDMNNQKLQEEKRKELIANISHELKTPITIIQGNINGLKNGIYTEEIYNDIQEETIRLNELVMEILKISKLESPSFRLKQEPFDLCGAFYSVNDKLRSLVKEKDLEVIIEDVEEAIVFGDEQKIKEVISNLYTNSIKYTPHGNKIKIKIYLLEDEEKYIFEIENFGVVLKKEELNNIWDPFYRGEKSRNRKFGGTGLGLAIVKKILEYHYSDFGVGSKDHSVKFYFTLNRCKEY